MAEKKYKVAIVISHVIQYAIPLYNKISQHPDIELTVLFCSDQGLRARMKDKGFGIKFGWDSLNLEGLNYKFLKNYSPVPSVQRFLGMLNFGIISELRNKRYDAVIIGGYHLASYWLAFFAAYISDTPFILTGEPPSPWRSRIRILVMGTLKNIFMPRLLRKAAAILYIGKKSKDYYLSFGAHVKEKLFFSPYSVDNDFYFQKADEYKDKKKQLRDELGIPQDCPVILFLGKLIKWKRPLFLLDVYRRLDIPACLVFVGTGYRIKKLKDFVRRYKMERVFFFGFQNYSQIPKFYAIADIFVFPSLGESWGLVINEALCFGLPVITTDKVMAAYDLVKNGENGFIIKSNDKKTLLEDLKYLLADSQERYRMGKFSLEVIKNWDYGHWIDGLIESLRFIKKK